MGSQSNEEKWTHFLSSIDIDAFKKLPANILKIETKSSIKCLATTFASKLHENYIAVKDKTKDTECATSNVEKNDMDISSCKWNISKIAKYFNFDDCVEIEIPTTSSPNLNPIYEKVNTNITCLLEVVRGIDLPESTFDSYSESLAQLIAITSIETGSRLVLDALLVPLCSDLGLQFEVEKSIKCKLLPNCRFDYYIRKEELIIGCIEAKNVKTLSNTSIAQAVLQLIMLQTTLLQTKTEEFISEFPVFAIVTDGHRFIYMQLKGSCLGFEHEEKKLKIRKVQKIGDFKYILQQIMYLVEGDTTQG